MNSFSENSQEGLQVLKKDFTTDVSLGGYKKFSKHLFLKHEWMGASKNSTSLFKNFCSASANVNADVEMLMP